MDGVAFKKTFSYAGFEQQPKKFDNPTIMCLNIELELKSEKENAEIRIEDPSVSNHHDRETIDVLAFLHYSDRWTLSSLPSCIRFPNQLGISINSRCRMEYHLREIGQDSSIWREDYPE